MSYKIIKDGLTIVVDTQEELKAAIDALGMKKRPVSLNPRDFKVDTDTFIMMYKDIRADSKAREALGILKNRPEGMTMEELVTKLKLGNFQALGGMFGGISKYAKKYGLEASDIYQWEYRNGVTKYMLTREMTEALTSLDKDNGE